MCFRCSQLYTTRLFFESMVYPRVHSERASFTELKRKSFRLNAARNSASLARDVFHVGSLSFVLSSVGGLWGTTERFGRLVRDAMDGVG